MWLTWENFSFCISSIYTINPHTIFSVNFKKNEKVYNPENSEVLKALQENDSEPEPGNDDDNENNDFRD